MSISSNYSSRSVFNHKYKSALFTMKKLTFHCIPREIKNTVKKKSNLNEAQVTRPVRLQWKICLIR